MLTFSFSLLFSIILFSIMLLMPHSIPQTWKQLVSMLYGVVTKQRYQVNILFPAKAWEQYVYWSENDRNITDKINHLIEVISRTPYKGEGKPEPLKGELCQGGSTTSIGWFTLYPGQGESTRSVLFYNVGIFIDQAPCDLQSRGQIGVRKSFLSQQLGKCLF